MKKQKSNISKFILVVLFVAIFVAIGKFIFFSNNTTYNNLKLIPKNCNNYLIINTGSIKKQITSYFFNYPSNLLSIKNNTENFKTEFGEIDFDLNEPISIFWDKNTNITVANFSIKGSEKLNPLKFDLIEIEDANCDIFINEKKNTIYYRDAPNNRVSVFFSDDEINPKIILDSLISKITINDTSSYNNNVISQFKNNIHSVIFNIENEFLNDIGLPVNIGEFDLKTSKISFKIKGSKGDHFIFKDSDSLKIIENCWGNICGNFDLKNSKFSYLNNLKLDSQWNGVFSIGLTQIKNVSNLLNINNLEELSEFFNFNLYLGNLDPYKHQSLSTKYGLLNTDSNFNGFISNEQMPLKLRSVRQDYFAISIDFEEMLNQKINDFSWNSIKLILKKFNIKSLDLKGCKTNENEFIIEGQLKSVDSTKHILLSPFI